MEEEDGMDGMRASMDGVKTNLWARETESVRWGIVRIGGSVLNSFNWDRVWSASVEEEEEEGGVHSQSYLN